MMTVVLLMMFGQPTASVATVSPAVQWLDAVYELPIKDTAPKSIDDGDCTEY
jgi:hypothetical protein